ncbi:MAG: glycosyltransferase family 39 protein [Syntrophaceae bacterium]|nr:glycosyltransferase family 39 protein [Syntrophaceae bacterium]
MIKDEKFDLILLLLLSILLSAYLFFRTYVISLDGAFQYIPIAKDIVSGFYGKAFGHNQQPLYSLFVSVVSRWVHDFETAGKLVSSFFGILIIFPVYFLGKRILGEKIALLSSLLLAIHPYIRRFSADVLKESTYLFFLATAIWFAWKTIQGEKKYPYLFIPILSVLAYLVRPDGVEILIVVFLYILFFKRFNTPRDRWKVIFLLALSSFILFLPYLIHLRETTGVWTLSRAKTIDWFLGLREFSHEVPWTQKILFSVKELNSEILSVYHPLYIFLLLVGFFKRIFSRFENGEKYLLSFFILHYGVLFLLVLNLTEWSGEGTVKAVNFSGRHVLPLLLFSVYWVGEGVVVLYGWVYKIMETNRLLHPVESKRRSVVVWGTLFILILAVILPKTLKPQRYERITERKAGIWIKAQSGKGATIFTTLPRVAFYAEGVCEYIDFNKDKIDKVKSLMTEKGGIYLTIREREWRGFPEIREILKKDFTELSRFEGKGMERVIVYRRGSEIP